MADDLPATIEEVSPERKELLKKLAKIGSLDDIREDKPKIRNRCRDCVAFHTHFCPLWDTDPAKAAPLSSDYACSDFFPRLNFKVRHLTYDHFLRNVENL